MTDRVLLIGGGGREHAMAAALAASGAEVHAILKTLNPGIAKLAHKFVLGSETDAPFVARQAREWGSEYAVMGPEAPIESGVTDALTRAGVRVASPSQGAGRIETDKAWMRQLLTKHRVPGQIKHRHFTTDDGLDAFIDELGDVAVKPVGLTGGKGVKVSGDHLADREEAAAYARGVLSSGMGGGRLVIEEKLVGEEFTLQCFADGATVVPTPLVQDHKRAFEGDEGPNTGGMGSYTDADHLLPFVTRSERDEALRIVQAMVEALAKEGLRYVGPIYGQFMLTADGPKVIEVNARFGDPEAMNALSILETPYTSVVRALVNGSLAKLDVKFARKATVCKYVVPQGYGTKPATNSFVEVDEEGVADTGARLYYAACNGAKGGVTTTTSRTLAVVGIGGTIEAANEQAEQALEFVEGDKIYVRHDIGTEDLIRKRVAHMRALGRGR